RLAVMHSILDFVIFLFFFSFLFFFFFFFFFFSSRRRHTRSYGDWSSDVCSSDLGHQAPGERALRQAIGGLSRREDWDHAGRAAEIGRAAGRGRGEISGGGGAVKKKKKKNIKKKEGDRHE